MAKVEVLIKGYREFYKKYFLSGKTLYKELTEVGQFPKTLVVSCSDSRVDPSIIMSAEPGDIFVIRNVANLVPPYEKDEDSLHGVSAALEFAVSVLKVENIVVMGHSNCAGISALLNSETLQHTDFIAKWVGVAAKAKEKTLENNKGAEKPVLQKCCEKESILLSLGNLLTFPWIRDKVENGSLKLHGWYFTLEDGSLQEYDPNEDGFGVIAVS